MRYMKIRFTEWRDPPAPIDAKVAAVSEIDAAQARLAEIDARATEVSADIAHAQSLLKIADSAQVREELAGHAAAADNVYLSRKAALAALDAAGAASLAAMKSHARVGTFGYQVIDERAGQVVKLVYEDGTDVPVSAVYGYEIIDTNPPAPAFAALDVKG